MCVFVYLSVLYRNPNCWMDRDEIWHRGGPREGKVLGFFDPVPPPSGYGCIKGVWGVSGASTVCFGKTL